MKDSFRLLKFCLFNFTPNLFVIVHTQYIFWHFSARTFLAPYLHQFSAVASEEMYFLGASRIKKIYAGTVSSKGDLFSEQHQHQSIPKSTMLNAQLALFWIK